MIRIGETLNSSIPKTLAVLEPFDEAAVREIFAKQKACGALIADLNTALCPDELNVMRRLGALCAEYELVPMFDSPDPSVLCAMLKETQGAAFVNSVTLTDRREILPLVRDQIAAGRQLSLVALPTGDAIPATDKERRENVTNLVDGLLSLGIPAGAIWVDLVVEALAADQKSACRTLDTLSFVREKYPEAKTVCGLSNVSFGLPSRAELNCTFISMLLAGGLTGALCNVTSPRMRRTLAAAEALLGEDDYCMNYLSLYRELEG